MSVPDEAIEIVTKHEGLRLKAYPDPATGDAPWTIGYGHTGPDVHPGLVISEDVAEEWLRQDLEEAAEAVDRLVKVSLTTSERAALISFVFNLGAGALATSTLLKKINAHDFEGAADEFTRWVHAGGKTLPGLVTRRRAEAELFLMEV